MNNESSKVALITGGSGGIGSTICKELSKKKIRVCFTYLKNKKNAKKILKEIEQAGGYAEARKMDIRNINSIKKTLSYFIKKNKKIDILINNSGISQIKPFNKISSKDWENIININLKGPFFLTKYFLKNKYEDKWCRIINISSSSGLSGGKVQIHYAITKAGLISLTKSLNNIYGKRNFTINAIAPGLINTPMIKKEIKLKKEKKIKIGKIKEADEVSKIILKIISEKYKNKSGMIFSI
jgi:NAD(P)-dependent dehydrogenase (short-subunit alcohol dehydrogenase family)